MLQLQQAFVLQHPIVVDYVRANGRRILRRVAPEVLLLNSPVWYLLALEYGSFKPKAFRLDRIQNVKVINNNFEPRPQQMKALLGANGVPRQTA